MKTVWTQIYIQLRMDARDKGTILVFYLVPLGFYAVMGAVFSSVNPEIKPVLSATMAIFSITMGAVIGLPPALVKLREAGVLRAYQVSGIPGRSILAGMGISAFLHLALVAVIISVSAPLLFGAQMPQYMGGYLLTLLALLVCSVALGLLIGVVASTQAAAMMISQAVFMPSLMLSGIMFPANLLPAPLEYLGNVFPATHAMRAFHALAYGAHTDFQGSLALGIVFGMAFLAVIASVWKFELTTRVA